MSNLSRSYPQLTRRRFLEYGLKTGVSLGLLGSGITLGGCAPQAPQTVEEALVQLNWVFNVQFAGFWAAQEKGYFAEQKIAPKFQPGGPNVQPENVVGGGGAPVGVSGAVANVIKAVIGGAKIKAIGVTYQKSPNGLMSLPAKPVRTLQDAVGKKIGLQPGARSTWGALLKRANIDPSKMEIVQVGVDPTPLAAGQVDAYWCFVINQPLTLKAQGIETVVVTQGELGVPGGANFIIANHDTIDKRRDLLARYLKALRKGWEYNQTHLDEITKLTVEKIAPDLKLDPKQQAEQNQAQMLYVQSDLTKSKGLLYMSEADWEAAIKFLVDAGEIEKAIPIDQVMTMDVLKAAFG
jgi:ABC-type nitrate/sulfonate/bicarbonate transport system substrate-binding protein